jgi:lysozyme
MISSDGLAILKRQEGYSKHMYKDSLGFTTIGYGLNLDAGIDEELASFIVEYLANRIEVELTNTFDWFKNMTQTRKDVVINMVYNLGLDKFKMFKQTISNMANSNFDDAAASMLKSKWATQVGNRAITLADMMRRG